ncbi:lamin tail domain-containing protein [Streptomyces sp. NPDC020817]|uniref:lamin tail domain-containing protein n=1 Tax=Streptomyces sp. NPDC020817 TaxID=3365095 RepID=UPI0037ACC07B
MLRCLYRLGDQLQPHGSPSGYGLGLRSGRPNRLRFVDGSVPKQRRGRGPCWRPPGRADSPGRDDRSNRSLNNEWVEITNTTRDAVNLRGWTLRDADGNRYRSASTPAAATTPAPTSFQNRRDCIWGNNGDTATLRDDRGRTVDTESWGRRHH